MTRQEADAAVLEGGTGSFVVRVSSTEANKYVLTACGLGASQVITLCQMSDHVLTLTAGPVHIPIDISTGKCVLQNGPTFENLQELVEHFQHNDIYTSGPFRLTFELMFELGYSLLIISF